MIATNLHADTYEQAREWVCGEKNPSHIRWETGGAVTLLLLIVACVTVAIGLVLLVAPKIPWLGNLPGDIHYRGKSASFHFPVVTCIVVSVILTLVLNVVLRLFRR